VGLANKPTQVSLFNLVAFGLPDGYIDAKVTIISIWAVDVVLSLSLFSVPYSLFEPVHGQVFFAVCQTFVIAPQNSNSGIFS
jgi:hypothetical protein